ncbi:MAG TPA: glycosyltransferase family 2 protein [Longimicrobiales bacterium]
MRVAVILSTYNWPRALELVLHGYAVQSHRDFEVVIADDGSREETRALIDGMARDSGLRLRHVWHPDRGFRKSEILNRAIIAADADYLVFSDGDTIPERDFVATHARFAERGHFLAGGYVKLNRKVSERITVDDVRSGRATSLTWLVAHGFLPPAKPLRWAPEPVGALLDRFTTTPARWHGNNASTFRDYLIEVNGFDMEMGYGGQDAALGDRLENLGVSPKRIRHRSIAVHLWHERPWRDPAGKLRNDAIRMRIQQNREIRATLGIAELESAGER